jgi:hypothetical protein
VDLADLVDDKDVVPLALVGDSDRSSQSRRVEEEASAASQALFREPFGPDARVPIVEVRIVVVRAVELHQKELGCLAKHTSSDAPVGYGDSQNQRGSAVFLPERTFEAVPTGSRFREKNGEVVVAGSRFRRHVHR